MLLDSIAVFLHVKAESFKLMELPDELYDISIIGIIDGLGDDGVEELCVVFFFLCIRHQDIEELVIEMSLLVLEVIVREISRLYAV